MQPTPHRIPYAAPTTTTTSTTTFTSAPLTYGYLSTHLSPHLSANTPAPFLPWVCTRPALALLSSPFDFSVLRARPEEVFLPHLALPYQRQGHGGMEVSAL